MRGVLVIGIFGFFATFAPVDCGGYKNLLCREDQSPQLTFCASDCRVNHGSDGGECGDPKLGDYNCYCSSNKTTPEYETSSQRLAHILNCNAENDDVRNVCTYDCICAHAAIGGYCDFKRKACICVGSGQNKENLHCPARTMQEYIDLSYNYLGPEVLGEYGMQFITTINARLDSNGNLLP